MNTNIYGDFQICISVPLKRTLVQGNNYWRTRLVTRSTCTTSLVTRSTRLTTRGSRSTLYKLVVLVCSLVLLVVRVTNL